MCAKNVHFILSKGKHVLKKNKKYNEERKKSMRKEINRKCNQGKRQRKIK